MVHFPGLARTRLWIQRAVIWFYQIGFPHSDISGSKPVCDSPELFAAYRVLHRLLAPRHSPYALSSLTHKTYLTLLLRGPRRQGTRVLQAIDPKTFRVFRCAERAPTRHAKASSPFHKTLLSSKNLRFRAMRNLRSAQRDAYFIQLSKSARFNQPLPTESSPRLAERETGLEPIPRKNCTKIKNPATSAGQIRPFLGALARCAPRTDMLDARLLATRYS
jgi:hypothetical protein